MFFPWSPRGDGFAEVTRPSRPVVSGDCCWHDASPLVLTSVSWPRPVCPVPAAQPLLRFHGPHGQEPPSCPGRGRTRVHLLAHLCPRALPGTYTLGHGPV